MKRRLRVSTLFALLALLLLSSSFALAAPPADKGGTSGAAAQDAAGAPSGGPWMDNFDSYPTGTSMHGVGGWQGWDNDPNMTAYTDNTVSASAPNSLRIDGGADLVHTYDVTTGIWQYLGKLYVPQNFVGESYLIFLNTYPVTTGDEYSAALRIDAATDSIVSEEFGSSAPFTRGQWMPWVLRVNLTNDTQSFTVNGTALYTDQPWSTAGGAGAVRIAAIDLWANGTPPVYYDDLRLVEEGPTAVELGGISSGSSPMGGWLISLLGLGLVAAGLIAKRR